MGYVIEPATTARFDDVATILAPKKAGAKGCWCLGHRIGPQQVDGLDAAGRADEVRRLTRRRVHAPGVLAYDDQAEDAADAVVGWAAISPRSELHEFSTGTRYPHEDDPDAWILSCFRVRAGCGGRGVSSALLVGAVDYARSRGATAVEAYPIDNHGGKVDRTLASVGLLAVFERAGFRRVGELRGVRGGYPQAVVRREL